MRLKWASACVLCTSYYIFNQYLRFFDPSPATLNFLRPDAFGRWQSILILFFLGVPALWLLYLMIFGFFRLAEEEGYPNFREGPLQYPFLPGPASQGLKMTQLLQHPLDEHYLIEPMPSYVPEDLLPPEDFEVAEALRAHLSALHQREQLGISGMIRFFLFRWEKAAQANRLVKQTEDQLQQVVGQSAIHRAALKRIVNGLPIEYGWHDEIELLVSERWRKRKSHNKG